MATTLPVKINLATAGEIAELYDVGPKLAQRIIEYRQAHGYFHGPEELDAVDGISSDLAITLAPHIDWVLPVQLETPKKREWGQALFTFSSLLCALWVFAQFSWPGIVYAVSYDSAHPLYYLQLWNAGSLVTMLIAGVGIATCWMAEELTIIRAQARWFNRAGFLFAATLLLASASAGMAKAIYFGFYVPDGWAKLLRDQTIVAAVILAILMSLFLAPYLLVIFRPSLRFDSRIVHTYDIVSTVGGPIIAWAIWSYREIFPLWVLIPAGYVGAIWVQEGVLILRTRQSNFGASLALLLAPNTLRQMPETSVWKKWINARLPDPDQQQELKKALDELHPPSRIRTITGIIVFGAGGWILATSISAVIEWVIQNWLNQLP